MRVSTMRKIDRWLGAPVCFLLTRVRQWFDWRKTSDLAQPHRILFIKLAEQGSTVLADSALREAIRRVGAENVYFVLFAENRPILDVLDLVPTANIISIQSRGLVGTVLSAMGVLGRFWRLGIDTAIDMEFFARSSAALAYLSGARWRVGYHAYFHEASYRGDLMTHRVSFNPYLHTAQSFLSLVLALEIEPTRFPTYPRNLPALVQHARHQPRPADLERVADRLLKACSNPNPARWVLLNANASDLLPLRRWPTERYVELAERLLAHDAAIAIAFTGAPEEAAPVEKLVRQIGSPRCVSMAGRTTLPELFALYCLAEVLVTNDSGPAHFASLTTTEVVVLFGPETPALFAAPSPRTHPVWAGIACSPCINAYNDRQTACTDNVCMKMLTVDQVFTEVISLLGRDRGPSEPNGGHTDTPARTTTS